MTARRHVLAAALALAACGATLAAQAAATASDLPDGPEAALVRARCLTCHGADLIVQQRLTQVGWDREVTKMVRWGAPVTDAERPAVVAYLTRAFGLVPRASHDPKVVADGEGIYKEACRQCHEDDLAEQQRLTVTGWTREVEKMMRWGARVSDAEKPALVAYLHSRWGRP
jgi:mono/diheme cytochrome c family protein